MGTEWTGAQQLLGLLQSAGLGAVIGCLFDILSGLQRAIGRRRFIWVTDALFGVLAGLLTFFGALSFMDGCMHPLLFVGILTGFLTEHMAVGRMLSRVLSHLFRFIHRLMTDILDSGDRIFRLFSGCFLLKTRFCRKKEKKNRKIIKKFRLFSKKA